MCLLRPLWAHVCGNVHFAHITVFQVLCSPLWIHYSAVRCVRCGRCGRCGSSTLALQCRKVCILYFGHMTVLSGVGQRKHLKNHDFQHISSSWMGKEHPFAICPSCSVDFDSRSRPGDPDTQAVRLRLWTSDHRLAARLRDGHEGVPWGYPQLAGWFSGKKPSKWMMPGGSPMTWGSSINSAFLRNFFHASTCFLIPKDWGYIHI